jgi:hypothetical protein
VRRGRGDAEIDEAQGAAVVGDEHVGGAHVLVDDARAVDDVERVDEAPRDLHHLAHRRALGGVAAVEGGAREVLHLDPGGAVAGVEAVHGDDAGARGGPREVVLAAEAGELGHRGERGAQALEHHRGAVGDAAGAEDHRARAVVDDLGALVAGELHTWMLLGTRAGCR